MTGKPHFGRAQALSQTERTQRYRARLVERTRRLATALARIAEAQTVAEARKIAVDAMEDRA